MIVDDADMDMEMAKDPFLEAGIAIPAELPYRDESQREKSARAVVGVGHQRHESVSSNNLPLEVEPTYEDVEVHNVGKRQIYNYQKKYFVKPLLTLFNSLVCNKLFPKLITG